MWHVEVEHTGNASSQHNANSVVILTGESVVTAMPVPIVENLNITKSSRVHIGPKYVSVTQNLQKTQVVKVRLLGLGLGSSKCTKKRRLAVFACCNIIAAAALAIYFVYIAIHKQLPLDIDIRASWYLRRADWQARDPRGLEFLDLPISYVIITHTKSHYCNLRYECIGHMLGLQLEHIMRGYDDISPNFLVSGNGLVFEGRGANVMGSMVRYWNSRSIIIAFMGDYTSDEAIPEQFNHINALLGMLVINGVLQQNYTLYAHCQVQQDTDSPGLNVIKKMERFTPHWNSQNSTGCITK